MNVKKSGAGGVNIGGFVCIELAPHTRTKLRSLTKGKEE